MSDKRYSVERWDKNALQAAQLSVGRCRHGGTIGIDMIAQDGNVFAHGHVDVLTASALVEKLIEEIEAACMDGSALQGATRDGEMGGVGA